MAFLTHPTIVNYVNAAGKRVKKGTRGARKVTEKAKKWYGVGIPGLPPKKRVPLASDKEAAQRMLDNLVRGAERGTAQMPDRDEARKTLADHLGEFEADVAHPPRLGWFRVCWINLPSSLRRLPADRLRPR